MDPKHSIRALFKAHQYERAIEALQPMLNQKDTRHFALVNLGLALYRTKRTPLAIEALKESLDLRARLAEAESLLGQCYLRLGDYKTGWPLYESRLKVKGHLEHYAEDLLPLPQQPEDIIRKRLFVHSKQGLGDTIQFVRYLLPLSEIAEIQAVEIDECLLPLLRDQYPGLTFVPKGTPNLYRADFQVPLLSLPYYLGSEAPLEIKPRATPQAVTRDNGRMGICWRGSALHRNRATRDVSLQDMIALCSTESKLVCLQKDPTKEDIALLEQHGVEVPRLNGDFRQTAELLRGVSKVSTVDTAMVHLAGSGGVVTNLYLEQAPDWRWGEVGTSTSWYPETLLKRTHNVEYSTIK